MVDTVYGERSDEAIVDPAGDLRARLEALARHQWSFFQRHPWALSIASGRSVLGPNEAESYDHALSVVADLGIPARDAVAIVDAVSMFVRGAARDAAEAAGAEAATGKTEFEWWTERDEILAEVMTPERFPTLARLAPTAGSTSRRTPRTTTCASSSTTSSSGSSACSTASKGPWIASCPVAERRVSRTNGCSIIERVRERRES